MGPWGCGLDYLMLLDGHAGDKGLVRASGAVVKPADGRCR